MQRVVVMDVQLRSYQFIVKEVLNQGNINCGLTVWIFRLYQWELYGRVMEGDRVIFFFIGENKVELNKIKLFSEIELIFRMLI